MAEFPTKDMALTHILVVADIKKSRQFYLDILGAELFNEYGGTSLVVKFLDNWLLLVTGGEPSADKPNVTFKEPIDQTIVNHAFTIRVSDCQSAYETLKKRAAKFITPPYDWKFKIRCFFTDSDGHLFEISEIPDNR